MSGADANTRWEESTSTLGDRSAYKKVWERQSRDSDVAALAVAGHTDEAKLDLTARGFIDTLKSTVGLGPNDVVLEIGCRHRARRQGPQRGVPALVRRRYLVGYVLNHAAARLKGLPNTTLVELATVGLQEFPEGAFDLVYCTIVFMHLLEWDRYRYVEEAFRILRPGGHAC